MERLWTPWRMAYVASDEMKQGCFLCSMPAEDPSNDEANLILARGALSFIIMNKFPYNSGHVIVAPFRHCANYEDVTVEEHSEVTMLTQAVMRALNAEYQPDGFNIGVNQGRTAGAGVPDHLHMHVVPRWTGDANYMTTTAETKVMPETVEQTYARLMPLLSG